MQSTSPLPGDIIAIEKLTPDGEPVISYNGWLVADDEPILVLARWESADLPLPYTTFARGDLLLEAYYRSRPYNIFALFDGQAARVDMDWGRIIARPDATPPMLQSLDAICQELNARCPLKGFYINFTRPVRYDPAQRRLAWWDLELDIWLPAQGPPQVLDEEAYRALNLAQTEPELARAIERAREQIIHDHPPF